MAPIWIIFGLFLLLSYWVSNRLKSKFKKYAKVPIAQGLTGKDIAERMLREHGIHDVKVISTSGELTDHYHPVKKTVNLSQNVYNGTGVSAAAVAAHECGHAVQHARAYTWVKVRSTLVPAVSFASRWVHWVILLGIILVQSFPSVLLFGIGLFALSTLFSIVTLPVEMDASKRAIAWLRSTGITNNQTQEKARDALNWASYTYVIAALSSLATLVYYVLIFLGARD
jgi:hypothetical protein